MKDGRIPCSFFGFPLDYNDGVQPKRRGVGEYVWKKEEGKKLRQPRVVMWNNKKIRSLLRRSKIQFFREWLAFCKYTYRIKIGLASWLWVAAIGTNQPTAELALAQCLPRHSLYQGAWKHLFSPCCSSPRIRKYVAYSWPPLTSWFHTVLQEV